MMTSQRQRGGEGSVNIQSQSVELKVGLTPSEATDMALQFFHANMLEMEGVARRVVDERLESFTDALVRQMAENGPDALSALHDPDIQHALFSAQRTFARTGAEELGSTLIDLLVARIEEETQSLRAIVLNESIETVGILTPGQVNALTASWLSVSVRHAGIGSLNHLFGFLRDNLAPFTIGIPSAEAAYRHLVYARCATYRALDIPFGDMWSRSYPGLFSQGFPFHGVPTELRRHMTLFQPCLHDPEKLQVKIMDEATMREEAARLGLSDLETRRLNNTRTGHRLPPRTVRDLIVKEIPELEGLTELWDETSLHRLDLTSVGVAIAHANWKRVTDGDAPLSVWIPDST